MFVLSCLFLFLSVLFEQIDSSKLDSCSRPALFHSDNHCQSIRHRYLSKMTCFDQSELLSFRMGTDKPVFRSDGESPSRLVRLSPFCLDQTEVSNRQFAEFVRETNHKTEVKVYKFEEKLIFPYLKG